MTEDQIRRILWRCIWMSRGSAPVDRDYAYWIPLWPGLVARGIEIHHPNYAEDRVLGWQAEGADVAAFGDYANPASPYHAVPPYPGDVAPPVDPPPVPPTDPVGLARLEAQVADVRALILTIAQRPDATVLARLAGLEAQIADLKGLILTIAQRPAPTYVGQVGIPSWLGSGRVTLTPTDAA